MTASRRPPAGAAASLATTTEAPPTAGGMPGFLARLDSFVKVPTSPASELTDDLVLVVVNDPSLASLLGYCLAGAAFRVALAKDAADGVLQLV